MMEQLQHGGQLRAIAERYGIPASELLDFSANINPEGPPPTVIETLRRCLEDSAVLTTYPDLEERSLKGAIARYASLPPEAVSVSNGFVPLLQAALTNLPIRHCLLPVPAFVEYRRSLELAGVQVTPHALNADAGFAYDFDALLEGGHDAVLLANPQNPSGALSSRDALIGFVRAAAARNVFVLLDEAFIDYAPAESLADQVEGLPNLVVCRSVTKFFAIPGLRVAYALASPEGTRAINQRLAPWPISTLASRAVEAALADTLFAERTKTLNEQRRAALEAAIRPMGFEVYRSAANFLLLRLPEDVGPDAFCERALLRHHVVLRNCSNYEGLAGGHVRVAVRSELENARLIEALRT